MISFSESFAKLFSAVFSNRNSFLKDNMVSNFAFVKKRKTQVITVLYLKSFFNGESSGSLYRYRGYIGRSEHHKKRLIELGVFN